MEETTTWSPGGLATWFHEERGGYGYVTPVPVVVIRATAHRVLVEAPLVRGGTKRIYVKPDKLRSRVAIHNVPAGQK